MFLCSGGKFIVGPPDEWKGVHESKEVDEEWENMCHFPKFCSTVRTLLKDWLRLSKRSYGFNSNMNPLDTNGGLKNHGGSEIIQVLTRLGLVLPIQVLSHS